MKTALRSLVLVALLLSTTQLFSCKDELADKLGAETTVYIELRDLEANGFDEDMRDVVLAEEISNWDELSSNVDSMEILEVQYLIHGNDGGDGSGMAFASSYQDDSDLEMLGQAVVPGGMNMSDFEPLPLAPGALDFANTLINDGQFTLYFTGDAEDIHFFVDLNLKVKITLKP